MTLNTNRNLKLYYTISEVAQMFGLNESTLRYWEKEFPYLKPKTKGPSLVRQYSDKDIEQIRLIHNLVKVRGFKLAAAKKIINSNRKGGRHDRRHTHPAHGRARRAHGHEAAARHAGNLNFEL